MLATNIKWDTDGDIEILDDLPTEVDIPYDMEEDEICDYLSDEYGYCVFGFDIEKNDGFRGIFIEGTRSGYSPDQCDETITVNQLIKKLEELRDCENAGDCPIYLCNDNGYTYGHINADTINIERYSENNGLTLEERW